MKTKKRRFEGFLFYDYEHVARHLEKMAHKGWLLSKITKLYWEYQRIEPTELHFAVTYFSEASQWNPSPSYRQEEFWAYCEAAGWKLAAEWEQMQIMYSEEENPVPVETDEHVKLEMIHRAMKKAWIPGSVALICLTVYQLLDQMPTRIEWFFYDANVLLLVARIFFLLYLVLQSWGYFSWYRRSFRSVENGGKCAEPNVYRKLANVLITVTIIPALLVYILLFGESGWLVLLSAAVVILLLIGMDRLAALLRGLEFSKTANIVTTGIVGIAVMAFVMNGLTSWISDHRELFITEAKEVVADDLLLVVEDLKTPDYEHTELVYELERKQSMFINWTKGRQYATDLYDAFDKLEYQIYEVKTPGLYDHFLALITGEAMIEDSENWRDINGGRWEADTVYQYQFEPGTERVYEELYVICQEDRIVRLGIDWETTEEELNISFEMLGIASRH
ncbi:MAG: DUF2812 domain-containing protein [Lachnospiraceae bacterium]|nr:DUF2812 domain-containing protein [Lachnospiraceae bacterium]